MLAVPGALQAGRGLVSRCSHGAAQSARTATGSCRDGGLVPRGSWPSTGGEIPRRAPGSVRAGGTVPSVLGNCPSQPSARLRASDPVPCARYLTPGPGFHRGSHGHAVGCVASVCTPSPRGTAMDGRTSRLLCLWLQLPVALTASVSELHGVDFPGNALPVPRYSPLRNVLWRPGREGRCWITLTRATGPRDRVCWKGIWILASASL